MRIEFTPRTNSAGYFLGESEAGHWSKILRKLKEDSGTDDWDYDKFYKWLEETWKIKVIISNNAYNAYPGSICAIEVDEMNYTMLLLRFPK